MQTEAGDLRVAWQALQTEPEVHGWRSIAIGARAGRIRAGMHYPEGLEAVLFGFGLDTAAGRLELPAGNGFEIAFMPEAVTATYPAWISIRRLAGAKSEIFALMCCDLIDCVANARGRPESGLLGSLLARVKAWQDFMDLPVASRLSLEAELGLAGELVVLEAGLDLDVAPSAIVSAWQGPAGGIHDFAGRNLAIEVKTTLSVNGFPAQISSLEQLDAVDGTALFLTAVRLCIQESGRTLSELISDVRDRMSGHTGALALFEARLRLVGYSDDPSGEYVRRFSVVNLRAFEVDDRFPRLIRSSVPFEIRSAEYELDLDAISAPAITVAELLGREGALLP